MLTTVMLAILNTAATLTPMGGAAHSTGAANVANGWSPRPASSAQNNSALFSAGSPSDWAPLCDTSCGHASGSAHLLGDPPRVLIAGGATQHGKVTQCTEQMSDPLGAAPVKWETVSPLLLPRAAHAGAVVNGTAYVFGGHLGKDPTAPPSSAPQPTATAEMLSAAGWVPAPPMPGARTGVRAAS